METAILDRQIILDPSLQPGRIGWNEINVTEKGYKEVRRALHGTILHKNYMEYLKLCWSKHYGVIISPDIVWSIISNELALHIKANATKYESLFTTTSGTKQEIIMLTDDEVMLPLDTLAKELQSRVPTDVELFIPNFSTTNNNSHFAFIAAFADAMQVYYTYSTTKCGIPKVKVLGTNEDWLLLSDNIKKLKNILTGIPENYFNGIVSMIGTLSVVNDTGFWNKIFYIERCMSGHPDKIKGWINTLFINLPEKEDLEGYPSLVSKVPYTFLDKNTEYELCYGLFGSMEADGFLIPDFGYIVNQKIK